MNRHTHRLLLLLSLLLVGCNEAPSERTQSPVQASESATTGVYLEALSDARWSEVLASEKGKIVVVDTWATWCGPCKEEFPHLVELSEKYANSDVTCISVSVDDSSQHEAALDFLRQKRATFANYRFDDENADWFDKWNIGAIPIVLVFNRQGELSQKFDKEDPDNQFTYEDVEQLVVEMLGN